MRGRSGVISQYVLAKEACGATSGIGLSSFQSFPLQENKSCHLSGGLEALCSGEQGPATWGKD